MAGSHSHLVRRSPFPDQIIIYNYTIEGMITEELADETSKAVEELFGKPESTFPFVLLKRALLATFVPRADSARQPQHGQKLCISQFCYN